MKAAILLLLLGALALAACADKPGQEGALKPELTSWTDSLFSAYVERRHASAPADTLSAAAAKAVQTRLVSRLTASLGPVIGYKAGLTSEDARRRFKTDEPVRGSLLEGMLIPSGTSVSPDYGARPIYEGDLIVRVGSAAINDAEGDEALAGALDAVIPFIELPDLFYREDVELTAPLLTASNVAARLGVAGDPVTLDSLDRLGHLRGIRIELMENDSTVAAAAANVLMGDPIQVVRWLRDNLREDGIRLQEGDLLSLGSLTSLIPVRPGTRIRAVYYGLRSEPVEIGVTFRPADGG